MILNAQFLSIDECNLKNTRIDIWEFPLDKLFKQASVFLNETELARANRYHFARHRRRFTVARASMRLILGRYLQRQANQLDFIYQTHGKPEIRNAQHLEFNLSHSGELALLAIGQQFPLGVDVEFFSSRPYDGIASHLFSKKELQHFLKLPNYLKPQIFFRIWAQKEAFIKANGLGLSYPTKLFSVPIFSAKSERIIDSVHHNEWLMTSFMPKIACSAALCYHPTINEFRYIRLEDPAILIPLDRLNETI